MKVIGVLLALQLSACSESTSVETVQFQGSSKFEFDDVATCISQDINSVFPRLFPAGERANLKTFRSYNGLIIDLQKSEEFVRLELRWDQALDSDQNEYLRFCLEHAYEAR